MDSRPPIVMIEQAPRPLLLSRVAGAVDLAIREMPLCSPKVERTASGGAMITSDDPMHGDLLIVHGQPGAPSKIRIINRLGDLAVSLVVPRADPDALARMRCGVGDLPSIMKAIAVMRTVSDVLHAATVQSTAYRPRTIRHDAMKERHSARLTAIGTLVLTEYASGRTATTIRAPTPWSSLCDDAYGPVEDGARLWGRLRPAVSLSVLGIDSRRNAWSIEMSPVKADVSLDDDAMGVLRILSALPRSGRRTPLT